MFALGVDPLARHIGNHGTDIVLAGVHAYVIHIGDDAALDNDGAGFLCGTQGVIAGIVRNHGQNDIAAGGHHILNVGNSSARVILKADGGVVPAILGGDLFQAVINADKELCLQRGGKETKLDVVLGYRSTRCRSSRFYHGFRCRGCGACRGGCRGGCRGCRAAASCQRKRHSGCGHKCKCLFHSYFSFLFFRLYRLSLSL